MRVYRAYFVGSDGHFKGVEEFQCVNDDQAKERAIQLVDGHDVELWSLDRFVAKISSTSRR
jgi:hypothetical protein